MVRPTRWCTFSPHIPPLIDTFLVMGVLEILTLALTHPQEFRILLQFWNHQERKRDITRKEEHASSGWDRPTMRRCWELLDFAGRSYASVIKELEGDLARVVSSFVSSVASGGSMGKNQSNLFHVYIKYARLNRAIALLSRFGCNSLACAPS